MGVRVHVFTYTCIVHIQMELSFHCPRYSAYVKGLPLPPRLPMILEEKEKGGERREGGEEAEQRGTEKSPPNEERIRLEKSNILLLGPTGSGKCDTDGIN